jgi:hypothetical protein
MMTPHMADMSGSIFYEQRSIATQIEFIEVPYNTAYQ